MLFLCHGCAEQCDLRVRESDDPSPPTRCPFERVADPRWREAPSGRETAPGAGLVPGPFCEIPAHAIARATASHGRYTIELAAADRLELPVSRAAFAEAVRAMEAVDGLR